MSKDSDCLPSSERPQTLCFSFPFSSISPCSIKPNESVLPQLYVHGVFNFTSPCEVQDPGAARSQIETVRSRSKEESDFALNALAGSVHHQGFRGESTVAVTWL